MLLDYLTNYKHSRLQARLEILLSDSHFSPITKFGGCSREPVNEAWVSSMASQFLHGHEAHRELCTR